MPLPPDNGDDSIVLWRKILLNQVERFSTVAGLQSWATKDTTPEIQRKIAHNTVLIAAAGGGGL